MPARLSVPVPERFCQATPASGQTVASFCTDNAADLRRLAQALREGQLVGIPTETVYGLAANALDEAACRRIFEVKGRPLLDPLIVHVLDHAAGAQLARFDERAIRVAEAFWPGPLTLVLPKTAVVPPIVTAGLATVALRSPGHPAARHLLAAAAIPLAAPSANPFGYISPTTAAHVAESLGDRIPYILDGGPCEIGIESTILDLTPGRPARILRPGSISAEALTEVLGEPILYPDRSQPAQAIEAPGMLERHYSPKTPVVLFEPGEVPSALEGEAIVFQTRPKVPPPARPDAIFWFSESKDPGDIARNLYSLLRRLDTAGFQRIHIEQALPSPLGTSINDRLRRAAATK